MGETWIIQRTRLIAIVQRLSDALRKYPAEGALATEACTLAATLSREISVLNDAKEKVMSKNVKFPEEYNNTNPEPDAGLSPPIFVQPITVAYVYDGTETSMRFLIEKTLGKTELTRMHALEDRLWFIQLGMKEGDALVRDSFTGKFRRVTKENFALGFSILSAYDAAQANHAVIKLL